MNLFVAPETLPFGVAFALMLGLGLLEVAGLLLSFSPAAWIDEVLLPGEGGADSALAGVLGWLHIGRVPTLALLLMFLAAFAVTGYALQIAVSGVAGVYLPAPLAALPACAAALVSVRAFGGALARVVPRDESSAVSEAEFIGRVATVTAASSRSGLASQARLRDAQGRTHFILAEPDLPELRLSDGMEVLLVRKVGAVYRVIANPHPSLI